MLVLASDLVREIPVGGDVNHPSEGEELKARLLSFQVSSSTLVTDTPQEGSASEMHPRTGSGWYMGKFSSSIFFTRRESCAFRNDA